MSAFVDYVKSLPTYKKQVVHIERIHPRPANYRQLSRPLPGELEMALQRAGLWPLYTHQAAAIDGIAEGKNVVVVTPAASGKTLCYNLPVLAAILKDRNSRALYLFPTKALAQDQLRAVTELASLLPTRIRSATFDGDTSSQDRALAKKSAQIVLSNPDMLHLGILPNHTSWSTFFRSLKYVVIDETHIYRGVFGSHVANVLRRLRRLLALYGAHPQFICCSATIANPKEHVEKLVGLPFDVIDEDGSPQGKKDFVLWNPPLIDEVKTTRLSANSEASFLMAEMVRQGIRTLTFARTRRLTELIYSYTRERLTTTRMSGRIKPYRAGYLPEERRQIEGELFRGELLGVVATNALELGIDIGSLDATVLTGYPGSIASTWQQAGRSGRRSGESLSILIGLDNPLDQHFMRHPESLFKKSFENALIDPVNPHVMQSHVLCAAWESTLGKADESLWGEGIDKVMEELEMCGMLKSRGGKWYPAPAVNYPADKVSIRSATSFQYQILNASKNNRPMETVEAGVAFSQIHPGAIYLHYGEPYLVISLDLTARCARVIPTDVPYYTQAKEITDIHVLKTLRERDAALTTCYLGHVQVTGTVTGFRKKMQFSEEVIGEEALDLPPHHFDTIGVWFDIPHTVFAKMAENHLDFAGGLHATEHALIGILPLFAMCDRNDLGGVSTPFHPDTGGAQIFIYDAHPGGTGIAEKGFEVMEHLWRETLSAVTECPCEGGCPSCIQSPKCGNNNQPLDKLAAQAILGSLLDNA